MKPEPEDRDDPRPWADLHRDASRQVDQQPDPRVRERVLAAARDSAAMQAARRKKTEHGWERSPRFRAVAAVLVVAVLTGLVASQGWLEQPERIAATATVAEAPRPAAPAVAHREAAPVPAAPAAVEETREHRIDRRAFTRDRDDPPPRQVARAAPKSAPAVPVAPPTPAEVAESSESSARMADAVQAERRMETARAAPSPAGDEPGPAVAAAPAPAPIGTMALASRALAKPSAYDAPEVWIARIVERRRAGDDEAADAELAKLRARYPGFTIPEAALKR